MNNQFITLLSQWFSQRNDTQWVLGTIIATRGSSYRKTGAIMFFGGMGQQFGLLSGGCLESDIMRHAKQVMMSGKTKEITYNQTSDESSDWLLGIGCGGEVTILLQLIDSSNHYNGLNIVYKKLCHNQFSWYLINLGNKQHEKPWQVLDQILDRNNSLSVNYNNEKQKKQLMAYKCRLDNSTWLAIPIFAAPHIVIFGGGIDAQPLVKFAQILGWQVTLVDSRTANARTSYFPGATRIIRTISPQMCSETWWPSVNAAVVMTHNISMDASALKMLSDCDLEYIGLLGPALRTERVLKFAKLSYSSFIRSISNPIGLAIGGELPESIALSIVAELHAVFEKRNLKLLKQTTVNKVDTSNTYIGCR